jgi:hypothetical protein
MAKLYNDARGTIGSTSFQIEITGEKDLGTYGHLCELVKTFLSPIVIHILCEDLPPQLASTVGPGFFVRCVSKALTESGLEGRVWLAAAHCSDPRLGYSSREWECLHLHLRPPPAQ